MLISVGQISRLEEELSSKNKAFKILEEKLQSQDDYEEIRRELGYVFMYKLVSLLIKQ